MLLLLSGCGSTFQKREVTYKPTRLMQPVSHISESNLLDVRVRTFAPGELPADKDAARGLSMDIREAEGYFIAVKLKDTMQRSGYWGPVRVVPRNGANGEVTVQGTILESDGEALRLSVTVTDATGARWYTKDYSGVVSTEIYEQSKQAGVDAFQFVYNRIANDIARYRGQLPQARIKDIRRVAELRFAAGFAPDAFSRYIVPAKGASSETTGGGRRGSTPPRYAVSRLPAENDPMYQRIKRIRAREHLLIDTLDQQYDGLARNISEPYTQWRMSRLAEMNAVREREELRDRKVGQAVAIGVLGALVGIAAGSKGGCYTCAAAGGALAGTAVSIALQQAVRAAQDAEAETTLNKSVLEEAGQSLAAEIRPIVVDVEGETVELQGTAEEKFNKWRSVLQELHRRELGPIDSMPAGNAPVATSATARASAG